MSGSRTIIAGDERLPNVHPGDVLRKDFLIGSELDADEIGRAAGIDPDRLTALLDARLPIDADLDLRLGRYFGMSDGFFLRLQVLYDVEEFKRSHGAELDRIIPRAA